MKKIYSTALILVLMVGILVPTQQTQAATTKDQQIAQLQQLVQQLTVLLNQLLAERTSQTNVTTGTKPNLLINQVSINTDTISGNSLGQPIPQQEIQIVVKNDSLQYTNRTNQMFNYDVYVYEDLPGNDKKTPIYSAGEIQVPNGGQSVTFSVNVEGGPSFNGDFVRTFYPKIVIDPDNKIKEVNEQDNTMKATGTSWETEYYKG